MVKSSNLVGQYAQGASIFTFVICFKYTRDCFPDLIAHLPKNSADFFFRACHFGRILEAAVDALPLPQPDGAGFIGIVTHSDDQIEINAPKLVSVFGFALVLDAYFGEGFDRFRVDIARGVRARAVCFPSIAIMLVDDRLRHLRAAGIACT